MIRIQVPGRVAAVACLLAGFAAATSAQTSPSRPPPRISPNTSQSNVIPAGVDTGTPATSDSMQLGTQVPPANAADKGDLRTRSAAARVAARPTTTAGRAGVRTDCSAPRVTSTQGSVADAGVAAGPAEAMAARGGARPQDAKPSALPGSGFTGSSRNSSMMPAEVTRTGCL